MALDDLTSLPEPPRIPPGLWVCFVIIAVIGTVNAVDRLVSQIGSIVVALGACAALGGLIVWVVERLRGPR